MAIKGYSVFDTESEMVMAEGGYCHFFWMQYLGNRSNHALIYLEREYQSVADFRKALFNLTHYSANQQMRIHFLNLISCLENKNICLVPYNKIDGLIFEGVVF
jgi:hypothetical protein